MQRDVVESLVAGRAGGWFKPGALDGLRLAPRSDRCQQPADAAIGVTGVTVLP